MFIRVKKNGVHEYLQLVSSERIDERVRQRVIGTLGRRDVLESNDALGGLAASLNNFLRRAAVLTEHRAGKAEVLATHGLGPGLVFGRLWDKLEVPAILAELLRGRRFELRQGDKSLVGNRGFRKDLKSAGKRFAIDREKVKQEERFDGKWVLRTDWSEGSTAEVALRYKDLWMVEDIFRTTKSILETRPIYHKCDETIRGHVFCSFLALVLRKELQTLLADKGWPLERADVLRPR